MNLIVVLAALAGALIVHEAAHGLVLRTLGVPISQAGIGLPLSPLARFKVQRVPFDLTISPWLVGAYVMPHPDHHKRIDAMPYRDRAWFLNAGIISNLLAGLTFWAIGYAISGRFTAALVATGLALGIWFGRREVAAYVLPALAVPVLAWIAYQLTQSWSSGKTGLGVAGMTEVVPAAGIVPYLGFFGVINLAIAAMNTMPLFGLDNGKVVGDLLQRWAGAKATRAYQTTGLVVVGLTMLGALGSDLWAGVSALIR